MSAGKVWRQPNGERINVHRKRWIRVVCLPLLAAFVAAGCTQAISYRSNSSHYVYPNSNVEPLGFVAVSETRFGVFSARGVDRQWMEELFTEAAAQKGGDILINIKTTSTVTQWGFPYLIFSVPTVIPIFTTTVIIEGVAARMEVGKQELN